MNTHFFLDPDSFQELLSNAFVVQESGMDIESLSFVVGLQESIATGELGVDEALALIAMRARGIAHADGVAIGLLQEDRLVYRAGTGSASTCIGQHVMATLCVSAHNAASDAILRVENTGTDRRVEAAICRQFGAQALLILPIYLDRAVVGVLQVLFQEAHAFQSPEMRSYRLMTGLIGEAMFYASRPGQKKPLPAHRPAIWRSFTQAGVAVDRLLSDPRPMAGLAIDCGSSQASGNSFAEAEKLAALRQGAEVASRRSVGVSPYKGRWKMAVAAAAVLVLASWNVFRPATSPGTPALRTSSAIVPPMAVVPMKEVLALQTYRPRPTAGAKETGRKAARAIPSRLPQRNYRVRHFSDDVTIVYFTPQTALPQVMGDNRHVRHISNDVTVRYFSNQPSAAPAPRPVESGVQPASR